MKQRTERHSVGYLVGVALAIAPFYACHGGAASGGLIAPQRTCGLTVWYRPSSTESHVSVEGSWDNWASPGTPLSATRTDGWRVTRFDLPSGEYTYAIVDDAITIADPNVPTLALHNGQEVSWVDVPDCSLPALEVTSASSTLVDAGATATGTISIDVSFLAGSGGAALDPKSVTATRTDGATAGPLEVVPGTGTIALRESGLAAGKYTYTLAAKDANGLAAEPRIASVWVEPAPFDPRDTVIYQVVVDRFRNASGPLAPPASPSARAGGTVAGVTAAIESGYFTSLGVNTLWISPLYKGPVGTFPGADGRPYSDYHGYWPVAERELEPTQADDASLRAMVTSAHAHGLRVLFDIVPNHVHQENPYWAARTDDSWFNHPDGTCVCGTPSCPWSSDITDCWFTPYLPDLAWQTPAVARQLTSDALWWQGSYDGDGVRIDAVPMMWRLATRRIVTAFRAKYDHPGHRSFLLGENFVAEGDFADLRYELGPQGLDSEFHFPLLWALQEQVAIGSGSMSTVDAVVHDGEGAWGGSGAVMSLIIGNQDVPRFSSVSAGDAEGDTWLPAPQSQEPLAYAKQQMALSLVFALPGAPTIYYGDEVGLAGRNDPDCRRVFPADNELSALQLATRETVQRLGAARSCSVALRRGTYRTLHAGVEDLVFAREAQGGDPVIAVALRAPSTPLSLPLPGIAPGPYVDLVSGRSVSIGPLGVSNYTAPSFSVALFVPSNSPCAALVSSVH